jgi:photosystem II stability/assembly factor-like uncharacterized protein
MRSAGALLLMGAALLTLVIYPIPLYPHHRRVGRFSVHSDRPLPADIEATIDRVERSLSLGGLDRPGEWFRVYLSHDPWKYGLFCTITRRDSGSQALVFSRSRSIIVSVGGIDRMRARTGGRPRSSRLEGSLAFAIAHEAAHLQVEREIRRLGLSRPPTWLSEGLADRTAAGGSRGGASGDGLADRARLAFDREAWRPPLRTIDQRHFRWQVLVDYLTDVRGISADELLSDRVSEAATERDLRAWMASATVGASDGDGPRSAFDGPERANELFLSERLSSSVPMYPINHVREILNDLERREDRLDALLKAGLRSGRIREWQEVGPGNVGGRTRALAIDPVDPETVYAAGVSGGVWKSVDGGESWRAADDLMANLAVTTIVIDPVDPRTLYAGTGEGFFWPYSMARGLGVFKSTDAGETWAQLEGTVSGIPEGSFHYVHDLVVSPLDHERLYAATQFGVWRSDDGGRTWMVVLANPRFISGPSGSRGSRVGCTDIAIREKAGNDVLLAAFGTYEGDGLYRSRNGGDSWTRVLTSHDQGRMTVAFAQSDPEIAYVSMAGNTTGTFGKLVDIFRSTDGGISWIPRVDKATRVGQWLLSNAVYATGCARDRPTYHQGWYDNVIAVDPVDADTVWVGGIDLYRSDDGGRTFHPASLWWAPEFPNLVGDLYVHADHHVLAFHPDYDGVTNQVLYSGNDGGIYRTDTAAAPTAPEECPFAPSPVFSSITWTDLNHGYGVTQFYHGDSARHADTIVGGSQDNGTVLVDGPGRIDEWRRVWRGDGGYVAFDPRDDDVFYVEEQGFPTIVKTVDGGQSFVSATAGISDTDGLFIVPFAMDPSNPDVLWTGGSRPWRTTDGAESWTLAGGSFGSEISAIAVAPTDGDVVYVGLNTGRVWASTDGLSVSPTWERRDAGLPSGWVSSMAVDPVDPTRAYLTISTFDMPHVFRTDDGGLTWRAIDGVAADGIPDIPCHWIAVRACDRDQLFVGTELGVFASEDGGEIWEPANSGLAHTVVEALDFKNDETLIAFTRGRGAFITQLAPCGTSLVRRPVGRRGP